MTQVPVPVAEVKGPKTADTVSQCNPEHPAWLRCLWHYDPHYAYDLTLYEYGDWHTSDPYYLREDVRLSPSVYHVICLDQFLACLETLALVRDTEPLPLTKEVPITGAHAAMTFDLTNPQDLQDLQALAELGIHLTEREMTRLLNLSGICEPDGCVWPKGTRIGDTPTMSLLQHGPPLLILECLSPSTISKDTHVNPLIYKRMGVQEYWICDPEGQAPIYGYVWNDAGQWIRVDARASDGSLYSHILDTRIRTHPEHGFQCPHPYTGAWLEHSRAQIDEAGHRRGWAGGRAEGLQEGLWTGQLQTYVAYVEQKGGPEAAQALQARLAPLTHGPAVSFDALDDWVATWQTTRNLEAWWQRYMAAATDTGAAPEDGSS